ncbi:MAG: 50S ribosomal protein L27, partial [Endomicrobiia bacterium]
MSHATNGRDSNPKYLGVKIYHGQKVKAGDIIGCIGNTAKFEIADPPHLHFEVLLDGKEVDPLKFL